MGLRQQITHNLINIPGWHTKRRIVVIESDDWGAIRMPSRAAYGEFMRRGIRVDNNCYCRYDGLATAQDLEALYDTLNSVKDQYGHPAILTANAVVANPDFDKIKESGFSEYFFEPFTETLRRSANHDGAFEMWQQGMSASLFYPQLHGREHLNVKMWMNLLQRSNKIMLDAFEMGTYGVSPNVLPSENYGSIMGAFDSGLDEDIEKYNQALTDAQELFIELFKYPSKSFIATTYTWSPKIEPTLKSLGVKYLQGMVCQTIPLDDAKTFIYKKSNFTGKKSDAGLTYVSRNCFFEPAQNPNFDWASDCLKRINIAFRWNKPAVISAHRINFIGSIDPSNTRRTLPLFKSLLSEIVRRWPDVEFMSTDQLGDIIEQTNL
jgi:hypothetical protein